MIPLKIEALIIGDGTHGSTLVLRPYLEAGPNPQVLVVQLGLIEAVSISMAISARRADGKTGDQPTVSVPENITYPQAHDLTVSMIESLGGELTRIVIDRVEGEYFSSKVVLEQFDDVIEIDAHPSEAIALAVRSRAPIFVEGPVFSAAAIPLKATGLGDRKQAEMEFHDFVENLSPEDFVNPGN